MDIPDMKHIGKLQLSPDAPFEQQFFMLLTRICRQLVLHADEQIKADDCLSPPQLWFLKRLYDVGAPQPISFFADDVFSNRSNASQMIDRLEAEGLVYRIRNPRDRRSVLVELTDEGVARMRHAEASHMQLARELLAPLSAEERGAALAALARVLSLFENDRDEIGSCCC
ncbi:MAG: MarR family transcriptional regulator [Chloroflexota bacterium]|nr:MarR family transcriptional regulator [Chloroflexota bacterium]MDE2855278.1 MarR family transcriptional regulator [Chloroflexota bacterium]MDE2947486.1 MarR family transcriptional regulator [Chloroflexota bacterium]